MSNLAKCRAHVQLTLSVDLGQNWNPGCTLEQVYDQAAKEAVSRLSRMLGESPIIATIIGAPKVAAVMVSEEN